MPLPHAVFTKHKPQRYNVGGPAGLVVRPSGCEVSFSFPPWIARNGKREDPSTSDEAHHTIEVLTVLELDDDLAAIRPLHAETDRRAESLL